METIYNILYQLFNELQSNTHEGRIIKIGDRDDLNTFPPKDIVYTNDSRFNLKREVGFKTMLDFENGDSSAIVLYKDIRRGWTVTSEVFKNEDEYIISHFFSKLLQNISDEFLEEYNQLSEKYPCIIVKNPIESLEMRVCKKYNSAGVLGEFLQVIISCTLDYIIER